MFFVIAATKKGEADTEDSRDRKPLKPKAVVSRKGRDRKLTLVRLVALISISFFFFFRKHGL